jgi:hypothetical protein|tara:strand:+ start:102 stop:590 length:489 start_codon:yes stop_codon:yes gene_type:complete
MMTEYPALYATFLTLAIYAGCSLYPVVIAIFYSPRTRVGYMLIGVYILFFASFILTATSESIALATELKFRSGDTMSEEELSALQSFRQNVRFLGYLVTFLVGGVGVSVFTKVVPSLGADPEAAERVLAEIRALRNETSFIKLSLLFIFVILLIIIYVQISA